MTPASSRTAHRRTLVGAALVAALAAVLAAIVIVRSTGEKVLGERGDTLVLVGKRVHADGTKSTTGELTDVGGCLGLTDQGDETVVIWPHGTTIETPDPLRVRIDGTVRELGDTIRVTGKGGSLDPSDVFYDKVPKECQSAKVLVAR